MYLISVFVGVLSKKSYICVILCYQPEETILFLSFQICYALRFREEEDGNLSRGSIPLSSTLYLGVPGGSSLAC